jgi:LysM repeat protein
MLKIPPVSGIVHEVKSGQTLSEIAAKYDIDEETIMRQNLLISASELKAGNNIIIPGAKKEEVKPVEQILVKKTNTKTTKKSSGG